MLRLLQPQIGSQGGRVPLASRGQRPRRRQAKPPHEVRILRAEHGYSARRRAVKTFKSAKGVWGKTRVFPHKQHIKSSRDYPPKQSGGLFRKHTTQLNYSLSQKGQALRLPITRFNRRSCRHDPKLNSWLLVNTLDLQPDCCPCKGHLRRVELAYAPLLEHCFLSRRRCFPRTVGVDLLGALR